MESLIIDLNIIIANIMKSHRNSTIAYLKVITESVDIIVKHLFLTVITPHTYTLCNLLNNTTTVRLKNKTLMDANCL